MKLKAKCPVCNARRGQPCVGSTGGILKGSHTERIKPETVEPPAIQIGRDYYATQIKADPEELFSVVQCAWNLGEILRLLAAAKPGHNRFRSGIDPKWIKEYPALVRAHLRKIGLPPALARKLFAPDNCPSLVVPHVAYETVPDALSMEQRKQLASDVRRVEKWENDASAAQVLYDLCAAIASNKVASMDDLVHHIRQEVAKADWAPKTYQAPLKVPCPSCGARISEGCLECTTDDPIVRGYHTKRREIANKGR